MAIIAGIDEAGLGPVMGPLVVSAAAFHAPQELLGESLWKVLAGAACRKAGARNGRIAFADSKKLYASGKPGSLANLERGVLSVLAAGDQHPATLRAMLGAVAPAAVEQASACPWYAGDVPLPHAITSTDRALAGNAIRSALQKNGMSLAELRCEPMFEGEYNRHVQATNNKSTTLFDVTSRLLYALWRNSPPGEIHIHVDRQGGRMHYLPHLQRIFDGCGFKLLDETETNSSYRITGRDRAAEVHFTVGCEELQLPVALASMLSKYVRELFMGLLNRFWAQHVPDLKPTAGYYADGNRFYDQIASAARRLGYGDELIYRSR